MSDPGGVALGHVEKMVVDMQDELAAERLRTAEEAQATVRTLRMVVESQYLTVMALRRENHRLRSISRKLLGAKK